MAFWNRHFQTRYVAHHDFGIPIADQVAHRLAAIFLGKALQFVAFFNGSRGIKNRTDDRFDGGTGAQTTQIGANQPTRAAQGVAGVATGFAVDDLARRRVRRTLDLASHGNDFQVGEFLRHPLGGEFAAGGFQGLFEQFDVFVVLAVGGQLALQELPSDQGMVFGDFIS